MKTNDVKHETKSKQEQQEKNVKHERTVHCVCMAPHQWHAPQGRPERTHPTRLKAAPRFKTPLTVHESNIDTNQTSRCTTRSVHPTPSGPCTRPHHEHTRTSQSGGSASSAPKAPPAAPSPTAQPGRLPRPAHRRGADRPAAFCHARCALPA